MYRKWISLLLCLLLVAFICACSRRYAGDDPAEPQQSAPPAIAELS